MCVLSKGLVSIAANTSGDHMIPRLLEYLEAKGFDSHHETLVRVCIHTVSAYPRHVYV